VLLFVVAVAAIAFVLQRVLGITVDDIEETVRGAGLFAPAVYALVLFLGLSVPFNPVSDLATVNVAALVFDPEVSVAATFAAHTVALSVNYLVGRAYGPALLARLAPQGGPQAFERFSGRFSLRTAFALRFVLPLTAIGIDFVSYIAGMRRLGFARFYVASIVPWSIFSVVFFYSTAYLRERSLLLFFVPALVLILGPSLLALLRRRLRRARAVEAKS
jgi:uncharacterized membrane protein YdjX (TVP38/TMEM64 family)